ncbi:MAG: CehA/McbA family metallohydrolase [Chitinivibrionales bacterium]|nr:CehA/McbA family metallohydrolase [Chitinivibrionales bacterium]
MGGFVNRYPLLKGYRHHTYFEGYDMPIIGTGPCDPVATPDGKSLIFSAKGWLWLYDIATAVATRITRGAENDFRPAISADNSTIAFVRDNNNTTKIMALERATLKEERTLIDSGCVDLDPVFSADGKYLFYSSSCAGDLNIWRLELANHNRLQITSNTGVAIRPMPLPDNERIVYISKTREGNDRLCLLNYHTHELKVIRAGGILSQTRPFLSPDGETLIINWPDDANYQRYQLWLININNPEIWTNLTDSLMLPLSPFWSSDKKLIYFVEADLEQNLAVYSMPSYGGRTITESPIKEWQWNEPIGSCTIETRIDDEQQTVSPARLNVVDRNGHPLYPAICNARFDSQNGVNYFHSPGKVTIDAPAGDIQITAVHGFSTLPQTQQFEIKADQNTTAKLTLTRIYNPRKNGWFCSDNHFHLNYGGPYYLTAATLIPVMKAEEMDAAIPMTANLSTRSMDLEWSKWKYEKDPYIYFGQEVRNHFLGHVGLINIKEWFWPWFYGPLYPIFTKDDIPNSEPLLHGRQQNGLTMYVHPVYVDDPFLEGNLQATPPCLIQDALAGNVDFLEIACTVSNEIGTSQLWYRLLNIGLPILPTAGSDTFPNFYRNAIFGSARIYVKLDGSFSYKKFLAAMKKGKSFVTTGPIIEFMVNGKTVGDVLKVPAATTGSNQPVPWRLDVYSPVAFKTVEIIVNGSCVISFPGMDSAGVKTYSGEITLPQAGWVAARTIGKPEHAVQKSDSRGLGDLSCWPTMHCAPFAHTAPIWIKKIGSVVPEIAATAAADLLRVLAKAAENIQREYGDKGIGIMNQLNDARQKLEQTVSHPIQK